MNAQKTDKLSLEEDISEKKDEPEKKEKEAQKSEPVLESEEPKDKAGADSDAEMTNEEKNDNSELASQIEEKPADAKGKADDKLKHKAELRADDGTINLQFNELSGFKGKKSEGNPFLSMLRKQYDHQDRKLDRVIRKEQELMKRITKRGPRGEDKP